MSFFDWPGKSDGEGNQHPAVLHMLDVAACAERLIEGHTAFRRLSNAQRRALVILVALHDVGKLSEAFRALICKDERGKSPHWQLSHFLLRGALDEVLRGLGADEWVRTELYAAVAGHHGKPPTNTRKGRERRERDREVGSGRQAALEWSARLIELFPDASLESMTLDEAKALSWALSGLTVAADWVGSNTAIGFRSNRIKEMLQVSAEGIASGRAGLRGGGSGSKAAQSDRSSAPRAACSSG